MNPKTEIESAPRRRFTDGSERCDTVIGSDVAVTGDIRGTSDLEIRGTVDGDVEIEGLVWLRAGGRLSGNLTATRVVIEGSLEGNIAAQDKVELRSCCHVRGDLSAQALAIAEGSSFEGKITMAGRREQRDAVSFVERRGTS